MNFNPVLSRTFRFFFLAFTALLLIPLLAHAGIEEHIIESESGFFYTVQKGDTLWDLSQAFSDSAWQWPDLWHYNPDIIANPHLIYPGQQIRIYKKGWQDRQKAPVEEKAPPEPERYHVFSGVHAVGFIRETAAVSHGELFKVKQDRAMISTDDKVYVRPSGALPLQEGSLYTVYRTSGPVNDPETNEYIGIQHLITGVIEIDQIEEGFAIGRIRMAFREIENDDMLMPFLNRSERIKYADAVPGLQGKIIMGEDDQVLLGEHTTAFIDKGSHDGVKPGQMYSAYYQETASSASRDDVPFNLVPEHIGQMMVVHTESTTSTVLITKSLEAMKAGTLFQPIP